MRALLFVGLMLAWAVCTSAGEAADPAGELLKPLERGAGARAGVVAAILREAGQQDAAARLAAAGAVERLGRQDAALAPFFAANLADGRAEVRRAAAAALARLGSAEPAVLGALAGRARESDVDTRVLVARALGSAGPSAKAGLPALVQMTADPEPRVRAEAALALGRLKSEARPALQLIVNLLVDKDASVRGAAARALGRIGDGAALLALAQYASGLKDEAELAAAYSAFLELGENGAGARNVLHQLVYARKDKWAAADLRGLAALARITGQSDPYARDLAALLKDEPRKRAAAEALALAPVAAAGVADQLLEALKDKDPAVVAAAARALGRIGAVGRTPKGPTARPLAPALLALLDSDDDAVTAAALRALGDIGDAAASAAVAKRADKFGGTSEIWVRYALTRLKQEPGENMGRLRAMAQASWPMRREAQAVLEYLEAGGRENAPGEID